MDLIIAYFEQVEEFEEFKNKAKELRNILRSSHVAHIIAA
jgi:hypothetical protein